MTTPFIGEIRMFGGTFAPADWALCQGQSLQIARYEPLFTLIGTTYGGDGVTTFNLPDLRGRIPVHQGSAYVLGQQGGSEQVTLTTGHLPVHSHSAQAQSTAGTQAGPGKGVWATELDSNFKPFSTNANPADVMNAASLGTAGGGQPHENRMPYIAINFIIALNGVYPNRG